MLTASVAVVQGLPGWSPIFVQYFQVLRLLNNVRQAATEPRLCDALAAVIQACAGRVQELHFHLVSSAAVYVYACSDSVQLAETVCHITGQAQRRQGPVGPKCDPCRAEAASH